MEISVLARQGLSIRAIAREMSCSRNTVRRYLKLRAESQAVTPRYASRAPRPCKLDPYKEYLLQRIDAARPHWIPATVLLRELRERGYTGGYTMLTTFLLPLKQPQAEPAIRYETEPGEQMQVDFTVIRRGRDPLLGFVATLGWSRATFVRFSRREDTLAWCEGIEAALHFFGGTPQRILFDNAKAVILERHAYGEGRHRWNPALLAVAESYGFSPRVCRPYRAQTKGKVERFNHYLKNSFVTPLAASLKQVGLRLDVEAANARVGPWLADVANARMHATTQAVPSERLAIEQSRLLALPTMTHNSPPAVVTAQVLPLESLQHPLSTYQSLLEARP